jgi:2-desacetyl-2-hydroxyethyl bacteriochlorophyllide A dehydrogenase
MAVRRTLHFMAPKAIEVREEPLPSPGEGQVLVETLISAISPGTEMLVYRGHFPENLADDHDSLSGGWHYPLAYGYACVGRVAALGKSVRGEWKDRRVFSFQPHTSHFVTSPSSLFTLPPDLTPEDAVFLPNTETAVNLVQDGAPLLGERVLVLGQGIVGLLTAALLADFPLEVLVTADRYPLRRKASTTLGVSASLDPATAGFHEQARTSLKSGADLTVEVSGSPAALDDALALTAFSGRVIIGSWYGEKRAPIDLGGAFHRSRIRLISSQVSTIAPELSGRWDKGRRFETAWRALERIHPEKWITHRFQFAQAAEAYKLLDEAPDQAIQVIFIYP